MMLSELSDEQFSTLLSLHAALSPESLTADGEIPQAQWEARKFELDAQLITFQVRHGLSQDDMNETAVYREHDRRLDQARRGRPRIRA